jgi:hypothetical protein
MADPDEAYQVEEIELSEFETGFIAGVLAAWGIKGQPTENQLRDALALMMAEAKELDGRSG